MGTHGDDPNWPFDYSVIEEIAVAGGDYVTPEEGFLWTPQSFNSSRPDASVDNNFSVENNFLVDSGGGKEHTSRKRVRSESCSATGSKACREKMRRDKLNERFLELRSILEPGKEPKLDRVAILSDAACMVTQLRSEARMLKESNENLQEKIEELKAEKNELRDEKQRLKAEKENLEQQIKLFNARPGFMTHPPVLPTTFAAHGEASGQKLMVPIIGYPGYPMWQFMPPTAVDTSQDTESCPPVA